MAIWDRNKVAPASLNGGNEYTAEDWVTEETFNVANNNAFYAVDYAEALGDTPDTSQVGNIGTPTVTLIDNVKTIDGTPKTFKKFKFANLKGEKGDAGINDALVVQEFGTSTENTISQKVITDKFDDLETQLADNAKVGLNFSNDTGDVRGTGAVDLQKSRTASDQVAKSNYSFIAGGQNNQVKNVAERGSQALCGHAEGLNNKVLDLYGHAEGANCIVDGKISHAEGNTVICTANDSHAEGNRTVAGRRYYPNITFNSEDAGDGLGVLQYVLIPDAEGDVTSYFPNILTDNIETRYGAGATKDVNGNILPPAPDNFLQWAMHSICILRGTSEQNIAFVSIAKAVYTVGVGTKVYYYGEKPFTSLIGIYSSYSPILLGGGNGQHAEGIFTSSWGYGAHAEGFYTRAWRHYAHTEGYKTKASGEGGTHAEGYETIASGNGASHAEGDRSEASGISSHAEGYRTKASGDYGSHAEGEQTIASGRSANATGRETEASGAYSHASGWESVASRHCQEAYSIGKITTKGDNQTSRISYKHTCVGVGWHEVHILTACEIGKAYHFDTMVLGIQTAGTAETIGDTFAYRFTGCFMRTESGYSVIGIPERTLVGRSSGMSGDGLTTGIRLSWSSNFNNNVAHLRYDGLADTTFTVSTYSTIQEMGL